MTTARLLFHITHTHSHETCPAVYADKRKVLQDCLQALRSAPEVAVISAHASPLDHVFFFTLEADGLASVVRAMAPLNAIGVAHTTPVMPLDDLLALVSEGL